MTDRAGIDVLVIGGPGLGHYYPISAFCDSITTPDRVAYVMALPPGHPVREKVAASGGTFVQWRLPPTDRLVGRFLQPIRRTAVRRIAPFIAGRFPRSVELPNLASRLVFALGSLIRLDEESTAGCGQQLEEIIELYRPRLILAERNIGWVSVLAARHDIAWAEYTTGPATEPSKLRPTMPAGLDPRLERADAASNAVLFGMTRLRERSAQRRIRRAAGTSSHPGPLAKFAFTCARLDDISGEPVSWRYVGLSPYKPVPDWRADPIPLDERNLILVSWSSGREGVEGKIFSQLLPVLESLSDRFEVVVQSGDERLLDYVRSTSSIVVRPPSGTPDYQSYQRARLVISHGGYGTINEAAAFGVPILVVPKLAADRMETARRVIESGIGTSVDRYAVTTERFSEALDSLLDNSKDYDALRTISSDLRDSEPARELVELLATALGPR